MMNNKKTPNKKKRGGCTAGGVIGAGKDTDGGRETSEKPRVGARLDDNKSK